MSATTETEAQRRQRLRKERILNRGTDRLNRIKGTFGKVQEETEKTEFTIAGGHELKFSTDDIDTQHISGISLSDAIPRTVSTPPVSDTGSISSSGGATPRRRAVGNLSRKRMESTREVPRYAEKKTDNVADIDSSALHNTIDTPVADPAAKAVEADSSAAGSAQRRFSPISFSRTVVRLAPVFSVFIYGLMTERRFDRTMGSEFNKWNELLNGRPDATEDWAPGNYLLWYLMLVELVMCVAYFALSGKPAQVSRPMVAQFVPGIPDTAFVWMSVAGRICDSASVLLFLTAICVAFV